MDQRRAEQAFADESRPTRAAGSGVLLVEDDFLTDRQAAAAVFGGPAHARPAVRCEVALPVHALLDEHVLVARPAAEAQRRELAGEVLRHPAADLGAELGVGR